MADRSRKGWLALPTLVGLLVALVCGVFVVRTIVVQWSDVRDDLTDANPAWLLASVPLATAAMVWIAVSWSNVMRVLGATPSRQRTVAWFFAGEIGKYVPGGVWAVLGRGEFARRGGIAADKAYPSVALSLATHYMAGLALATVLLPLDVANQAESPAALALLVLLPVGLVALHPKVLEPARNQVVRFTGKGGDIAIPPWRSTLGLVARYVPGWLLIWAATWCVARALMPAPSLLRVGIATMLAWTAGLVAVPVPAGAGVREVVFVAASGMAAGPAATVAIGSRLIFSMVDIGGALLSAPWHRNGLRSDGPAGPADPGDSIGVEPRHRYDDAGNVVRVDDVVPATSPPDDVPSDELLPRG